MWDYRHGYKSIETVTNRHCLLDKDNGNGNTADCYIFKALPCGTRVGIIAYY